MINLARLEGFYRVGKTGGFSRAARAFSYPITQPGVHQQVRRLEEELGVQLFERVGRDTMELTPAGNVLYEFVAEFFEALPGVEESVRSFSFGGKLRVAASPLIARDLLPPWLCRLRSARADIELAVIEFDDDPLMLLRRHDADLVVEHLTELADDIEVLEVATIRAFIAVPESLARGWKRLQRSKLRDCPFVSYPAGTSEAALQRSALDYLAVAPSTNVSAGTAESLVALVAAGVGFSIVPAIEAIGIQTPGVRAFPINHPDAVFPIFAAWRRIRVPNPLVQAAIACYGAGSASARSR